MNKASLVQAYESFGRIEELFKQDLDESLHPRGAAMLYDLVGALALPRRAAALDVGCGEGGHSIELARRFGLDVRGVDPLPWHLELARRELERRTAELPALGESVRFEEGSAESLPVDDAAVDLVWCRDVLVHVEDLPRAYGEFRRVLKPGGRALVYQMFATELLEPREAERLLPVMGCVAASMVPANTETAIRKAGLRIDRRIAVGTEWGEHDQESSGKPARQLLHAARLLRDPDRYVQRFGQSNYDLALGDCLWHVYRMIGKLSGRIYVLSSAAV
jgi:SAM-dependent methyltransferase